VEFAVPFLSGQLFLPRVNYNLPLSTSAGQLQSAVIYVSLINLLSKQNIVLYLSTSAGQSQKAVCDEQSCIHHLAN
jgi:hypothetical protein